MTCNQDNLIGETMSVPGNINIDVASAQPHGTRRLMLSDNPETLTATNVPEVDGTLWHDVVHTTDKTVRHRIFGWHYNKTGGPVCIGVTIENKNGAPMVLSQLDRELKVVPETASWIIDVGQCIAKSCLAGTMESIRAVDPLQACRGVSLLEQFEVPEGSLAGFVYDLTLTRPGHRGKLDYEIRTVVSKDLTADLREVVSAPLPPVPPPQAHPRGSWSFSETDAIMPEYIIGTSANYRACAASRLDGTAPADLLFTAARSELGPALDNRGQFGVIYHVTIPIYNPLPEERQVRIYANPRGGAFAGSVRLDNTVYGIPLLRNNTQVCRLADITAPPGRSSYSFSFMVAGSASTPLGIYVMSP